MNHSLRVTCCAAALALLANACVGLIGDRDEDGGEGSGSNGETTPTAADHAAITQVMRVPNAVYRNALVDVLGLSPDVVAEITLPTDGTIEGFTNHNDLDPSGTRAQVYASLAEEIAELAVADGELVSAVQSTCSEDCLPAFVERAARRLFGRAIPDEERDDLVALVSSLRETLPEHDGLTADLRLAVTVLLQSPHFLFRIEASSAADEASGSEPVRRTGHEVARALAWSLWLSVPDHALVDAAEAGELDDDARITEQIGRMLADPRARRGMIDFVDHTLHTDRFAEIDRTDHVITSELRSTWVDEVRTFASELVYDSDGTFADLLLSSHTYVNQHNAHLYGAESQSEALERIELDDRYAGLLTMSGWLALEAKPNETHPIVRGARVLEKYLCIGLSPVSLDEDDLAAFVGDTVRERVESGTANPSCQGCHATINPLGFAFEGFDEVGQPQTEDNGQPVDTTGAVELPDGSAAEIDGARSVAELVVESEAGRTCFAERLLTHMRGFTPDADDPLLAEVEQMHGAPIVDVIASIAETVATRHVASDRTSDDSCL